MQSLRVVTYNVQRWACLERIVAALEGLRPEVLALNEVNGTAELEEVRTRLSMASCHFFGHALGGNYGNAILTRRASKEVARLHLAGGSVVAGRDGRPHRIARGAVAVSLADEGVVVVATHFDHMAERERAAQAEDLLRSAASRFGDRWLLCGDLNALVRSDYDAEAWAALEAEHADRGWAGPSDSAAPGGAVAVLEAAGFGDLARGFGLLTSPAESPRRRIDHVFSSPGLRARAETAAVDPGALGSDHLPLVVDVAFPAAAAAAASGRQNS